MSNNKYVDAPDDIVDAINAAERIDDFLPPPAYFAESLGEEESHYIQSVSEVKAFSKKCR